MFCRRFVVLEEGWKMEDERRLKKTDEKAKQE